MAKMKLEERVKRQERKDKISIFDEILIAILCIIVIIYLIFLAFSNFYPNNTNNKVITFNITGIVNSTNVTTLTQLHFECIKYCINSQANNDKCWKECSSLGNENNLEGCMNKVMDYYKEVNENVHCCIKGSFLNG